MHHRLLCSCFAVLIAALPPAARAGVTSSPADWSKNYTLVLLDPGADPAPALRLVQSQGGAIAIVVPPSALLGWIPPEVDAGLLGREGIRSIHRRPLGPDEPQARDPITRVVARTFGRAVRGELSPGDDGRAGPQKPSPAVPLLSDGRPPGPISASDVRANLRSAGNERLAKVLPGEAIAQTSEYMTGTVSLTLFFVESNGAGSDPDQYDWTSSAEQEVFDQAISGLSWWSHQALERGDCWVAFYVHAFFATQDPRCSQWREPILHSSGEFHDAISAVLGNFGYSYGSVWSRAAAFDANQVSTYGTDWAYCAFVGANPLGPDRFTDGYSAWAYFGGPFTALLQHSFSWPFGQVFAHETGHIFRACDEYFEAGYGGCTDCGACNDTGVLNGNCEYCNPSAIGCMMRMNSWVLCSYTPGQIGWWRTPCAPPRLPPPVLVALDPAGLLQDSTGTIQIAGEDFAYGMRADFGSGIEVLAAQTASPTLLEVQVHVDRDALPGPRTVRVTAADLQSDSLPASFQVLATRRHYASASGSNLHPYTSPATAGSDLAAVVAACSDNDTLLVAAGTYGPLALSKSLAILGGWDASFSSRQPDTTPTILAGAGAGPVVMLTGSGRSFVLDGLVLRAGSGTLVYPPGIGACVAGGGLFCFEAEATLRHCILEDNFAGNCSTPGVGGGAIFWLADARIEDCTFRRNHATRGAGAFFLESTARLARNAIEANEGDACAGDVLGAGLGAAYSQLELRDDVVRANLGGVDGGGIHLESCPGALLDGVVVEDHAVTGSGGAIWADSTHLVLRASTVRRNIASLEGGGILAIGDSLEITATGVAGNHAEDLGGGVNATGCVLLVRNATLARNTGLIASGIWAAELAPGSEVQNSIVTANGKGGLVFDSGTPPALDWNVFWGNSGQDYRGIGPGAHDLRVNPSLVAVDSFDLHLAVHSVGIDSGDPDPALADPDGSRNDRGAYGGPNARPDAPPRVTGLTAVTAPQGVRLAWQRSPAADVAWYALYRSTDSTSVPSAANLLAAVSPPDTVHLDTSPVTGACYVVSAVDSGGYAGGYSAVVRASFASDALPAGSAFALRVQSPCAVRRGTWVSFELPTEAVARLDVFTIDGRLVRVLARGRFAAGPRRLLWDGRDAVGRPVAAGVYFLRLRSAGHDIRRKLVVT